MVAFRHEPAQSKTTFILPAQGLAQCSLSTASGLDGCPLVGGILGWMGVLSKVGSWGFFICSPLSPQGRHKCECKSHYVGDGVDCEPEQLPLDRCLQDNGQCHPDANCADLHFQGQCGWGACPMHLSLQAWVRGVCRGQKKDEIKQKLKSPHIIQTTRGRRVDSQMDLEG